MKLARFFAKELPRGLAQFVVMLSFMVVIFAVVAVPANQPIHGLIDFLLYSAVSRFTAAFVMVGVFGWLFCFGPNARYRPRPLINKTDLRQ